MVRENRGAGEGRTTAPSYCLERASKAQGKAGGTSPSAAISLSWGDIDGTLGRPAWPEFSWWCAGESLRREPTAEGLLKSSAENESEDVGRKITQDWGQQRSKGTEGRILRAHARSEVVHVPSARAENPHHSQGNAAELGKSPVSGKASLVPPNEARTCASKRSNGFWET